MKLRIRSKFVGILVIASMLPLGIALVAFNWFGGQYFRKSQGLICETAASQLAQEIGHSLRHEIDLLDAWIGFTDLGAAALASAFPETPEADVLAAMKSLDARWPTLPAEADEVRSGLQNPLAQKLRAFQKKNPHFSEILVADSAGRLLAATNKTTDYYQADEAWWQEGMKESPGHAYVEGVTFDDSAGTHSIDITIPLYSDASDPDAKPVAVLKAIMNVMPFFQKVPHSISQMETTFQVVTSSGEIVSRLGDPTLAPLTTQIGPIAAARFHGRESGWFLASLPGFESLVMGFAPIGLSSRDDDDLVIHGFKPMWAVSSREDRVVMAPIHSRIRMISLIGIVLTGGFVLLGYYIASQKIIDPITRLRRSAEAISRTARLEETPAPQVPHRSVSKETLALLDKVRAIESGDEIGDLAREFEFMGQRILSYHEKLESDIAAKTLDIRRDLDFAKQFQTHLMVQRYPEVPPLDQRPALGLSFHHIYEPASSVGGDFFHVMNLGDSKAGVFIADVMGHGARSALVTAIVATLLQDIEGRNANPAEVLKRLNSHFHKVVNNSDEVIFVSAFYMILDVREMSATFASAGHPSPLLLDRMGGQIVELTPCLTNNPALGIFENSTYEIFSRTIREHDMFLLFTDGLFECLNADGEEFGRRRVIELCAENQDASVTKLTERIVEAASTFSGPDGFEDDVCLVGVEILQKVARPSAQTS